jgi:peptidoglycan/LPS O-acetylase OafA/YrhL
VVALALAFDVPPARELWPWLLTYTLNVYITLTQTSGGPFGHFWSLAVEEQFYLIWPWVVLFAPRKALVPLMLAGICLAPVYRGWAYRAFAFDVGAMDFKAATLTVANLDTLGAGALLALLWRSGTSSKAIHRVLTYGVLPAGVLLYFVALIFYHYRIRTGVFFVAADLASAMMFAWLVNAAALGFRGTAGTVLQLPPVVYLGRISYGIYVYHNFSTLVLAPVLARFEISARPSFTMFVLSTAFSVSVAMISWHAFESPINKLKRRFDYTPGWRRIPPEAVAAPKGV